jgi:hypothetical protein
MDWEELDEDSPNFFYSLFIGLIVTLFFLSNAGQYIAEDELLNGSTISNGRYAITYNGYEDISTDESKTVVGIGSSILMAAMDGGCMSEISNIQNSKFYNMAMSGSHPYVEMIQTPTLIESSPDVVMIEIGPNSLWGWNTKYQGLIDYHEFRFTLSSMQMTHDLSGGWYDILEQKDKEYFSNSSLQRDLQWSDYTRNAIDSQIEDYLYGSLDKDAYNSVPDTNSKEWYDYLQTPKHKSSKYDTKNESQIRQDLDTKMEKKVNQGVYNPKSNGTQNHAALEYLISSLNNAGIEVVIVGIPHHPWVNGYLEPGQLDGMNETYSYYSSKYSVHPIQMYWESWNSSEFSDRNHLDSDGRERFCQQVTPFIDEVLLGNKPLYVAEIE